VSVIYCASRDTHFISYGDAFKAAFDVFPSYQFLGCAPKHPTFLCIDHTHTFQYLIRASGSRARLTLLKKSLAVLRKVDRLAITRPHQS
jgi:hypothetical protein